MLILGKNALMNRKQRSAAELEGTRGDFRAGTATAVVFGAGAAQTKKPISTTLQATFRQGYALHQQRRFAEAERTYEEVLRQEPHHFDARHLLGVVALQTGRTQRGAELIVKAIELNPNVAAAHHNLGSAFSTLKRPAEALASYDKAIALKPGYAEVHNNRGAALNDLKRPEEALASCDKAIALKRDFAEAYNNRGNSLNALKRYEEALASCDKAIALKPDLPVAYNNRGIALNHLKRHEEALASYDKAIALKPQFAETYNNRGHVLNDLKRPKEALASYDRAIALKPDCEFLLGDLIHTKMKICDWSNLEAQIALLVTKLDHSEKVSQPLPLLAATTSPELQRKAAEIYSLAKYPLNYTLSKIAKRPRRETIRLGYFSADFRSHALMILMAELFETHNRSQFEVTAFSFGKDTRDEVTRRLETAFDKFIDVRNQSDRDVASLARNLELDIAVDLGGFTTDGRTNIFSMRAAPMQVNFLGYPGTMGAEYIDYIIADSFVIPDMQRQHYREKIVYLPNTFQANISNRKIGNNIPSRAEMGLPENGFVFCSFNNSYKITPTIYDIWMRILQQNDRGVLWLLGGNANVESNLRKEAEDRGVNSARVIFASRVGYSDYLARYQVADLFLDTFPFNAGTTASDALWAGLPLVTCSGVAFASRMAGSLLRAIGMPEMATASMTDYEALANKLARNPDLMTSTKMKLADNRFNQPLFNTQLFTRHIEAAYTAMYERYQADLPPDHIYVPQ